MPVRVSKRMSRASLERKLKPRSSLSSCWELTPEVHEDAVDGLEAVVVRDLGHGLEVSLPNDRTVAEAGEALAGALDGSRIGIDPQQPAAGVGGLQDPNGVPSAADGRIDLEAARVRRESQDDLLKHHGQVPYFLFHQRSDRPDGPPGPWRLIWF